MPRNEALLEAVLNRARTTRHPRLIARDANMCPRDIEKSLWFQGRRCMWWPRKGCPRARRKAQKMYGSKERMIVSLRVVFSEENRTRPYKAASFVVERGKEMREWNEQKLPKVLPGYSGGRLPGRSTEEKGREEGEVDEDGEERRIRSQIIQEVVAGIEEKVSVHDGVKEAVQNHQGKVSREAGIAHRLKMKKRRKAGEKGTKWQHRGMKSRNWRRSWKEEEDGGLAKGTGARCAGTHVTRQKRGEGSQTRRRMYQDGLSKR